MARILLILLALGAFIEGSLSLIAASSVLHQIYGMPNLVAAAILLSAAVIVDALVEVRRSIKAQTKAGADAGA